MTTLWEFDLMAQRGPSSAAALAAFLVPLGAELLLVSITALREKEWHSAGPSGMPAAASLILTMFRAGMPNPVFIATMFAVLFFAAAEAFLRKADGTREAFLLIVAAVSGYGYLNMSMMAAGIYILCIFFAPTAGERVFRLD